MSHSHSNGSQNNSCTKSDSTTESYAITWRSWVCVAALVVSLPAVASTAPGKPTVASGKPTAAAKSAPAKPAVAPLDAAGAAALVKRVDERQRNSGDYKSLVFMRNKERGKQPVVTEAVIYRRDRDDRFMFLFLKPKAERGKGYLKIDRNLWLYDPSVGRWERRTERERIGGTNSRRADLDERNLTRDFTVSYLGIKKLGRFTTHGVELKAKKGVDVPYPKLRMWVDALTDNVLKQQDFAASGRLMRTSYTPKWRKVFSPMKKRSVWVPKEMRVFDEIEKGNSTTILIRKTDLRELPKAIFSKAWLESKSR
ncbi:MAG: outer membrane lipoprotein-sorting protein [Myxococcales bacterium]|nr:outer membrane lipoprotein-sorting protein [Myxococcales bacterium]